MHNETNDLYEIICKVYALAYDLYDSGHYGAGEKSVFTALFLFQDTKNPWRRNQGFFAWHLGKEEKEKCHMMVEI